MMPLSCPKILPPLSAGAKQCQIVPIKNTAGENSLRFMAVHLQQLVNQMAVGHHEAVGELYGYTSSCLRGALSRMLQRPEDVEEALFDVYMKAWSNAADYSESRGGVRAWLMIIAKNTALDRLRHQRRRRDTGSLDANNISFFLASPGPSPETCLQDDQLRSGVRDLLVRLPSIQRQVIEMVYFHGLTHVQIANVLSEPLGTVKSRIRNALLRLRVLIRMASI